MNGTRSYWFKHPKYPFQFALKKYGLKAFRRYTLFVFDTYDEARNMEKQIVNEEFIKRPDTYNVALGGGCGLILSTEVEVHRYDLEGNYMESYRSHAYAARKLDGHATGITHAILCRSEYLNSYWSESLMDHFDIITANPKQDTRVYVYDKDGNYIETVESMAEYARKHDVRLSCVQRAIRLKNKCSNNYLSLEKIDKFIIEKRIRKRNKKIYQYDSDGNFVQEYENSTYLKPILKDKYNRLHKVLANGEWLCGYRFSYEKLDYVRPKMEPTKKIAQYDLDGNLVKIWDSYRECEKEFTQMRYVLRGLRPSTKGFVFKYYEEKDKDIV